MLNINNKNKMKTNISITIGDKTFYMDEEAYKILNDYLKTLNNHLTKEKIIEIENEIADILDRKENKNVISEDEIKEAINQTGKFNYQDFSYKFDKK